MATLVVQESHQPVDNIEEQNNTGHNRAADVLGDVEVPCALQRSGTVLPDGLTPGTAHAIAHETTITVAHRAVVDTVVVAEVVAVGHMDTKAGEELAPDQLATVHAQVPVLGDVMKFWEGSQGH